MNDRQGTASSSTSPSSSPRLTASHFYYWRVWQLVAPNHAHSLTPDTCIVVDMSSNGRLVQPDPLETTRSASDSTMAQNAATSSSALPSSPNAGPSSTLLFPLESSVTKRKRSQPAPSKDDSNRHHHNHMPPSKKVAQLGEHAMYTSRRKKSKSSTPVDELMPPSYSTTANDIDTQSSKRQKTRANTSSSTASIPPLRSPASRFKRIVTGKKRKHAEQYDTTPGPSSATAYPTPRSLSPNLSIADSACSIDSEDDDSDDDLTFGTTAANSDQELVEQSRPVNERTFTDVDNLNNLLRDACDMLSWSQKRLRQSENDKLAIEDSVQKTEERWAKVGMDAMLERVRIQEECKRNLEAERNRRMKARASHEAERLTLMAAHARDQDALKARHKVELFEAHAAAATAKAHAHMLQHKLNNSIITASSLEAEVHNGRCLLAAAEEDLHEMASVKAQEADEGVVKGLPPAYGDLDDEEHLAPWDRHQDGGPLEVALVKHTTRKMFNDTLQKIMEKVNAQRKSPDQEMKKAAGCELLRLLSAALSSICTKLKPVIDQALFADRAAKLIIEFCWQIVAAFEIRPISVNVDELSRIAVDMHWRDVDNILTDALEAAYRDKYPRTSLGENLMEFCCPQCKCATCSGYCVRLNELQTILEQLNALRSRLEALSPKHKFLTRVCGWAGAAVETDLVFAALAN